MSIHASIRVIITAGLIGPGCAAPHRHDHERDRYGQVIYLDGAGGGSALTNWGRGVEQGLIRAGFLGGFDNHTWQTGLGVVADQEASVEYKRARAGVVAAEMASYAQTHPGASMNLVALSAGTAVAVYALEQLPEASPVDNVVLLGSSLSKHYDLTRALQRVRNRMYVFTSEKDAVLRFGVSALGTADREFCGACSAGLNGFHLASKASRERRRQYAKVENVEWRAEFARAGNLGGHTDAVDGRQSRFSVEAWRGQPCPRPFGCRTRRTFPPKPARFVGWKVDGGYWGPRACRYRS